MVHRADPSLGAELGWGFLRQASQTSWNCGYSPREEQWELRKTGFQRKGLLFTHTYTVYYGNIPEESNVIHTPKFLIIQGV